MAIYDSCQVLCPWPLCVSNCQVIGRVASPYCYKELQKSGAAERGTLGGPVHTPAWTQYCACCCGLALLALCVLSAPGPKSASLKGHIPCAMLLEFHTCLIQYGKSLLQFYQMALSPSQWPLSLSSSSFHFVLCCNLNCLEQSVFSVFGALRPECYAEFCWREKNMLD